MSQRERNRSLNDAPARDGAAYVLYWMQQAQRASGNPALEHAIGLANRMDLPVLVGFGLTADYLEANWRHYAFMLEGLAEVEQALAKRGIRLVVRQGQPPEVALALAERAAVVVCDRGYLRHQAAWRAAVARDAGCRLVQVEGEVVVPVETASDKRESAARTLRPKLHRAWDGFLQPLGTRQVAKPSLELEIGGGLDLARRDALLDRLKLSHGVPPVRRFKGGTSEARQHLQTFLDGKLQGYAEDRNEPAAMRCSFLSPYLHFGQISPVEVALAAREQGEGSRQDRAAFLEELIVRRELAMNFVHYEERYDRYEALPAWARATLDEHRRDRREHLYAVPELEAAATHDPYWNAAMREMVHTGFMHNYMRMYWAKKILEWSRTPEEAFATTLQLNNRWFLDGRDPNSFANVAWVFGLHDRPWQERPIFGKVRYMNDRGLERKFDMAAYSAAVDRLVAGEEAEAEAAE
jgi:deoxyribodipyrimidine photo-lyase